MPRRPGLPAPTAAERLQTRFVSVHDEAVVSLLIAAGHIEQRVNDLCRAHGLTHDQYNVLRILRGAGTVGHPRCEVAARMINRAPDVTRLLDRLVRQDLVERSWGEENRRLSIARITPAGRALLARLDPELERLNREFTGDVPAAELRGLARLCDRIAGAAGAAAAAAAAEGRDSGADAEGTTGGP